MTSSSAPAGGRDGGIFFYAGWAGFALFGTLAHLMGNADVGYAVFHIAVAAALCVWFARSSGKAAPVVGAVLGTLWLLQMLLFVSSGFSDDPGSTATRLVDGAGLLAAVLTLVGALRAVRHRGSPARRTGATTG